VLEEMFGWYATMGFFTGTTPIPTPFAFLEIAAEFFGGMGLILRFPDPKSNQMSEMKNIQETYENHTLIFKKILISKKTSSVLRREPNAGKG